jgi:murein DD-endopeptidase MepM/ murein hydrolase activator NlpD
MKGLIAKLGGLVRNKAVLIMDKLESCVIRFVESIVHPFANRRRCVEEIRSNLNDAKRLGKKAYIKQVIKSIGKFQRGTGGVFSTVFNYVAPVVSIAFLLGMVNYVSGLEYGLNVEYNGQQMGVVAAEGEVTNAAKEVQKRINYVDGTSEANFSPQFSLKVLNGGEQYVNSDQLADKMISSSDEQLTNAYGVYVDGEFIGAVADGQYVSDQMDKALSDYASDVGAKNARFQKTVTYEGGIYLKESLVEEKSVLDILNGFKMVDASYKVSEGDTPLIIADKCNTKLSELEKLNPGMTDVVKIGDKIKYQKRVNYMPIEYTKAVTTKDYIDYKTEKVKTDTLYKGTTEVLTKGVKGEKTNVENVTYVDGVVTSKEVISSQVTKQPVTERLGIGTYVSEPADGSTPDGSGMFIWPVAGGYISDPFMSDRHHKGMDIAADTGTSIFAAAYGVVIYAGWDPGGYGNTVRIDHGNGYVTVYAHQSEIIAKVGDQVKKGDLIGRVGSTGDSTGSHCHFEVRINGIVYNPEDYIK